MLAELTYALFDDLAIPGTKTLVGCNACGMIYDDTPLNEPQVQDYYRRNDHYAYSGVGGGGGFSPDDNARYDRIIDAVDPGADGLILDYGCGQGGCVARCRQRGISAAGIEPSTRNRNLARQSGLRVYATWEDFIAHHPPDRIHALVFSHVLEHMLEPGNAIRQVAAYARNARVYAEVPDAGSYFQAETVHWPDLYFEHLCHFRRENLVEFAERSGIETDTMDSVPFSDDLRGTRCLFLVGRFSATALKRGAVRTSGSPFPKVHPGVSLEPMPQDGRPAAIWGVSQYAMLLLGSAPTLAGRVSRLFDGSPAKIGRSINGVVVEPSERLNSLSRDALLLIPRSKFLNQMLGQLHRIGFTGVARVV